MRERVGVFDWRLLSRLPVGVLVASGFGFGAATIKPTSHREHSHQT